MPLRVAVQMDPIAAINIRGDSTFALLLEAQARGVSLEERALGQLMPTEQTARTRTERRAILARLRGLAADRAWSSEDFLRERHEEARREAAKSQ